MHKVKSMEINQTLLGAFIISSAFFLSGLFLCLLDRTTNQPGFSY